MGNTYADPFRLTLPAELGDRLRRARRGRSLRQTAQRAGISSGHLSKLENGLRAPSGPTVAALDRVLGLDDDLVRDLMEVADLVDEGREERHRARVERADRLTTTRSRA